TELGHAVAELLRGLAAHLVDLHVAELRRAIDLARLDARDQHLAAGDAHVEVLLRLVAALDAEGDHRLGLAADPVHRLLARQRSRRVAVDREDPVPILEAAARGGAAREHAHRDQVAVAPAEPRADPRQPALEADAEVLAAAAGEDGAEAVER